MRAQTTTTVAPAQHAKAQLNINVQHLFFDRCFTAPAWTAEHNKILLNVQVMPHRSTQCNRCQQSKVQMLSAQVQPYIFLLYAVQSARHKCCADVHSLMSAFVHVSECACIRAAVILKFGGRWLHSCLQALHAVGAQTSLQVMLQALVLGKPVQAQDSVQCGAGVGQVDVS